MRGSRGPLSEGEKERKPEARQLSNTYRVESLDGGERTIIDAGTGSFHATSKGR